MRKSILYVWFLLVFLLKGSYESRAVQRVEHENLWVASVTNLLVEGETVPWYWQWSSGKVWMEAQGKPVERFYRGDLTKDPLKLLFDVGLEQVRCAVNFITEDNFRAVGNVSHYNWPGGFEGRDDVVTFSRGMDLKASQGLNLTEVGSLSELNHAPKGVVNVRGVPRMELLESLQGDCRNWALELEPESRVRSSAGDAFAQESSMAEKMQNNPVTQSLLIEHNLDTRWLHLSEVELFDRNGVQIPREFLEVEASRDYSRFLKENLIDGISDERYNFALSSSPDGQQKAWLRVNVKAGAPLLGKVRIHNINMCCWENMRDLGVQYLKDGEVQKEWPHVDVYGGVKGKNSKDLFITGKQSVLIEHNLDTPWLHLSEVELFDRNGVQIPREFLEVEASRDYSRFLKENLIDGISDERYNFALSSSPDGQQKAWLRVNVKAGGPLLGKVRIHNINMCCWANMRDLGVQYLMDGEVQNEWPHVDVYGGVSGKHFKDVEVPGLNAAAYHAIDGNPQGYYRWPENNLSLTDDVAGEKPWWNLDLGSVRPVRQVVVFNRSDCCGDELRNFVLTLVSPYGVTEHTFTGVAGDAVVFDFPEGTLARSISLQKLEEGRLGLAEVAVLECERVKVRESKRYVYDRAGWPIRFNGDADEDTFLWDKGEYSRTMNKAGTRLYHYRLESMGPSEPGLENYPDFSSRRNLQIFGNPADGNPKATAQTGSGAVEFMLMFSKDAKRIYTFKNIGIWMYEETKTVSGLPAEADPNLLAAQSLERLLVPSADREKLYELKLNKEKSAYELTQEYEWMNVNAQRLLGIDCSSESGELAGVYKPDSVDPEYRLHLWVLKNEEIKEKLPEVDLQVKLDAGKLKWTEVEGATGYRLALGTTEGGADIYQGMQWAGSVSQAFEAGYLPEGEGVWARVYWKNPNGTVTYRDEWLYVEPKLEGEEYFFGGKAGYVELRGDAEVHAVSGGTNYLWTMNKAGNAWYHYKNNGGKLTSYNFWGAKLYRDVKGVPSDGNPKAVARTERNDSTARLLMLSKDGSKIYGFKYQSYTYLNMGTWNVGPLPMDADLDMLAAQSIRRLFIPSKDKTKLYELILDEVTGGYLYANAFRWNGVNAENLLGIDYEKVKERVVGIYAPDKDEPGRYPLYYWDLGVRIFEYAKPVIPAGGVTTYGGKVTGSLDALVDYNPKSLMELPSPSELEVNLGTPLDIREVQIHFKEGPEYDHSLYFDGIVSLHDKAGGIVRHPVPGGLTLQTPQLSIQFGKYDVSDGPPVKIRKINILANHKTTGMDLMEIKPVLVEEKMLQPSERIQGAFLEQIYMPDDYYVWLKPELHRAPQWGIFDLGDQFMLHKLELSFGDGMGFGSYLYRLDRSVDGVTWEALTPEQEGSIPQLNELEFEEPHMVRYVRLVVLKGIPKKIEVFLTRIRFFGTPTRASKTHLILKEVSGQHVGVEKAALLNDGDLATGCALRPSDWGWTWVQMDLGNAQQVDELSAYFGEASAHWEHEYLIRGSLDQQTWHTLVEQKNTSGKTLHQIIPNSSHVRYVRLYLLASDTEAYDLREIKLHTPDWIRQARPVQGAHNWAFSYNGGKASQISTGWGGVAARANDNFTSGIWRHYSVNHTYSHQGAWWKSIWGIDLPVREVVVYNRAEVSSRLSDFTVSLSDKTGKVTSQVFPGTPSSREHFIFAEGTEASEVKIELNKRNYLHVSEVQAFDRVLPIDRIKTLWSKYNDSATQYLDDEKMETEGQYTGFMSVENDGQKIWYGAWSNPGAEETVYRFESLADLISQRNGVEMSTSKEATASSSRGSDWYRVAMAYDPETGKYLVNWYNRITKEEDMVGYASAEEMANHKNPLPISWSDQSNAEGNGGENWYCHGMSKDSQSGIWYASWINEGTKKEEIYLFDNLHELKRHRPRERVDGLKDKGASWYRTGLSFE